MSRLLSLALLFFAAPAMAEPFELDWAVDAPLITLGYTLWLMPQLPQAEFPNGHCAPCDRDDVNALDHLALGLHSDGARLASDVGVIALPTLAIGAAYGLTAASDDHGQAFGDAALIVEAMGLAGGLNQVVRHAYTRPRPFMYDAAVGADDHTEDDWRSFYSGHTSAVFSAAAAFITLRAVRSPDDPLTWALGGVALAGATTVGALRVAAGKHFPSDVLTGALVGSCVGILVPALHRTRRDGVNVTPSPSGLSLSGQF